MIIDIEQRLRDAHPDSVQFSNGSTILLDAAEEIAWLRGIVAEQQRNCSCPYGDCSTCEKAKAALR